ncbi:hypothetical protein CIB48_g12140 [Xylaria polymorpha]|nr:hypothetical protein CIB48_g12140 [Xylaria polymorpha]
MSDQNDGLNAFRGILSRSVDWSYYGVPLVTRAGRGLSRTIDPIRDYVKLPRLPETVDNGVRIVVEIGGVTFQPREGESTYGFDEVFISIAGRCDATPYEIHLDCPDEPPHHGPDKETTWNNLGWKLVLISRTSIYNVDPKWRHMWEDWQPTNVFLVIQPCGRDCWERVGLLKMKDKLYQNAIHVSERGL